MKAQVPYLARLARQVARPPMLKPPRQLFTDDIDPPVRSADTPGSARRHAVDPASPSPPVSLPRSDSGRQQPALEATASVPAEETERARETGRQDRSVTVEPGVAVNSPDTPTVSAWPEPAAGPGAPPDSVDMTWPPPVAPPGAGHPEVASVAAASPANPAGTRPGTAPTGPLPSRTPRPAAGSGPARPPGSWVSALRERPVELPEAIEHAPAAGQADRRAAPVSRAVPAVPAVPAAPPPGPGPIAPAGSRQDQHTDDAAVARRAALGPEAPGAEGVADLDGSSEPTPVRDLMPKLTSDHLPAAIPRTEPGQPLVPRRPRVSIGTIEVTVVPPAPAVREIRPPVPVTRGWSRPPSPFAASAGADRLRNGLRRWYGTAQG